MTNHHAVDPNCPEGLCWPDPNGFDCVHVTNPKRAQIVADMLAKRPPCKLCRERADEIGRLKQIIADQDERIIRMIRQRSEFNDKMEAALARLIESQQMLQRQLQAGRTL